MVASGRLAFIGRLFLGVLVTIYLLFALILPQTVKYLQEDLAGEGCDGEVGCQNVKTGEEEAEKVENAKLMREHFKLKEVLAVEQSKPWILANTADTAYVRYGISYALSQLNYEFSENKTATMPFSPEETSIMEVAGLKVGERVPIERSRQILVATTWRSGSTFLGDLLNHYPGVFYFFEPLHYFSQMSEEERAAAQEPVEFLRSLFNCSFSESNAGFLKHAEAYSFLMKKHNKRLWNSCTHRETICLRPEYLNQICPFHPIRLVKTVRLRVAKVEKLMQDSAMDLRVVLLVRDPRGVYNSREGSLVTLWCKEKVECADPKVGCRDLADDIVAAEHLAVRYPGKVTLVRYEDLSLKPEQTARQLFNFLDLPWLETITDYIETHTRAETKMVKNTITNKWEREKNASAHSTAKNSTATAFAWMRELGFKRTLEIQRNCRSPMRRLGYRIIHSQKDLHMQELPIEKTSIMDVLL